MSVSYVVGELIGTVGELIGTVGELIGTVGDLIGTVGDFAKYLDLFLKVTVWWCCSVQFSL